MGVDTLIPVQEAFHVDNVANFQSTDSSVDLGLGTGQVTLHAEAVGSAVVTDSDIDVVAGLAVLVLDSLDGQTGEGNELVLMSDQLLSAQQLGDIDSLSDEGLALKISTSPAHSPLSPVTRILVPGTSLAASSSEQASSYRK